MDGPVDLVGIPEVFPLDPEPEFVDINLLNIAAVTLQENNHLILIYLPTGVILKHWHVGTVELKKIDVNENDLIELNKTLSEVPRSPTRSHGWG